MPILKKFLKYKATLTGILIGGFLYGSSLLLDVEYFEEIVEFLERLEHIELDELIIVAAAVLVGVSIDLRRNYVSQNRELEINGQKLRTLRATMHKVDDIVGNAMNGMLLFQMQAKKSGALNDESLEMFDKVVRETTDKLREIGDMEVVSEKEVSKGVYMYNVDPEDKLKE